MLGECRRDLMKLHKRQMSLNKRISAEVEEWTGDERKLGQLVERRVEPQPSLRISLD